MQLYAASCHLLQEQAAVTMTRLSSCTELIQLGLLSFISGSSCWRPIVLTAWLTRGHS